MLSSLWGHPLMKELILERDPRTAGWPMVGNKQFLVFLFAAYIYVVKIGGPRFMKNRKPYEGIKPLIIAYNASMVLLNCYFMVAFLKRSYLGGGYSLLCQGVDYEVRDEVTMGLLNLCWWYLLVRMADFLDTVFFMLRKKDSHASFLHMAHHILIVFNGSYGLAYGSDGQITLGVILNSFVHVVMYSYYLLSLLGPAVRKHLWWKRYLTQLQLVQFIIVFTHNLLPLFISCGYPRPHTYIMVCEAIFFFTMFIRFYFQAYKKKKASEFANNMRAAVQSSFSSAAPFLA
ncbi:very long chain fatty acid elongase AAEL008004-like [Dermacentor andersoni]|uniref:very long chain fatty acid elongase AAEL008004-like n=1 Tax=Dermacentor andersoni TaxID=34620 RepID=UPI003B3A7851